MRILRWTIALLLGATAISAQIPSSPSGDVSPHQVTAIPNDARFAIVQAPYAAKGTFLLDRYLGRVWQLAGPSKEGLYIWQSVPVKLRGTEKEDGKVNYVMFVSGIGLRFTFLVNIRTGASWQFATSGGEAIFSPTMLEEQK
jgi:hypothetical protein